MPTNRRQQKRARHAAKRKAKRKATRPRSAPTSVRSMLTRALKWPLMECWVNADWKDPTQLNQVIVARRNPMTGEVYAGVYLVDRACLGVKDAYPANFVSAGEFRRKLLVHVQQSQDLMRIDFDLAAAIVKAGLDYAAQFGFRPHRDYHNAAILLQDAKPEAVNKDIPVGGPEGKPFFIVGPHDNAQRILSRLERNPGPGNYHFMAPFDPEMEMELPEEMWEEVEVIDEANVIDAETEAYVDADDIVIIDDVEMLPQSPEQKRNVLSRLRSKSKDKE